jgi:hypothetical protein
MPNFDLWHLSQMSDMQWILLRVRSAVNHSYMYCVLCGGIHSEYFIIVYNYMFRPYRPSSGCKILL